MVKNKLRIMERFARMVESYPDKTAVADAERSLSFSQLDRISSRIAADLKEAGGRAIGVMVTRSVDIVVGALAALKAGGIFMPIDDSYPAERIGYMLEDSQARYLLTSRQLWESVAGKEDHALNFDEKSVVDLGGFADEESTVPYTPAARSEEQAALILYTSGTTGKPKGVVHTDKSLTAIVDNTCHLVTVGPQTNVAVMAGFTFIASQFLIFTGITMGASLHIVDDTTRQDIYQLYDFINRREIGLIFIPPMVAVTMVEELDLSHVTVLSAGEKLRGFTPKCPCQIYNMLGSTEGVSILACRLNGGEKRIPLGTPIEGVEIRIVDEQLQDVPEGKIGELIYSSDVQAREYLGRPELSAEKWFADEQGRRWFRMGDRVQREADGNVYYVGRNDNMVKIRGFRVETGEVERQISMLDPRTEWVVVLRNVHGIDHLVCFYQAAEEADTTFIKTEIAKRLAEYMIPDIWVRVDRLPRNQNGKVDRKQLPTPASDEERLCAIYNEVEMRVLEMAKSIVGEAMTLDDNFFECGGTSLSAIKLAAGLRQQGIQVASSQILQLKVLRKVVACAEVDYQRLWTDEQYAEICDSYARRGETIQKVLPLTNEQEDLLFRQLMNPDSTASNSLLMFKVDSHLDQDVLHQVISALAQQYDTMRTSIVLHHRYPFQQVVTDRRVPLDYYTLDDTAAAFGTARDIYHHLKYAPFDYEWSSHFRFVYVEDSAETAFLIAQVCTIVNSMSVVRAVIRDLMAQLSAHYPEDSSVRDWKELMQQAMEYDEEHGGDANSEPSAAATIQGAFANQQGADGAGERLIRVYSPMQPGKPSVVFVHTGNTGSDAYYSLADKIGEHCGFAVIEPYNLYHQDDIRHGIEAIAAKYVEILRTYQPEGPYILGGWCYGGVVAHEMACQLQQKGIEVKHLFQFDAHALTGKRLISLASDMQSTIDRSYLEECPLFQDLRDHGMLEAVVRNYTQVAYDILHHEPKFYNGPLTYFKPMQTPMAAMGKSLTYWQEMMKFHAGNYENFCNTDTLRIVEMPHEHDLMMDNESLAVSVPVLLEILAESI